VLFETLKGSNAGSRVSGLRQYNRVASLTSSMATVLRSCSPQVMTRQLWLVSPLSIFLLNFQSRLAQFLSDGGVVELRGYGASEESRVFATAARTHFTVIRKSKCTQPPNLGRPIKSST
jgi:hypothetical protein